MKSSRHLQIPMEIEASLETRLSCLRRSTVSQSPKSANRIAARCIGRPCMCVCTQTSTYCAIVDGSGTWIPSSSNPSK
jgi:hypothetical protein